MQVIDSGKPIACALCYQTTRTVFTAQGRRIVRCLSCRVVQTYPPSSDDVYHEASYFVERNRYIERGAEFREGFGRLLDRVQRYKASGTLLDVGCGPGTLLDVARERGFAVQGVEISDWAVQYAREELGISVLHGALRTKDFAPKAFDVVITNHALEHIPDPKQTLRNIHSLLKDDGLLVVGVPNFASIMAQLKRAKWQSLLPEQHLWHFTPASLATMLHEAGFQVVDMSTEDHETTAQSKTKRMARSSITWVAQRLNRGEAMLVMAYKRDATRS